MTGEIPQRPRTRPHGLIARLELSATRITECAEDLGTVGRSAKIHDEVGAKEATRAAHLAMRAVAAARRASDALRADTEPTDAE